MAGLLHHLLLLSLTLLLHHSVAGEGMSRDEIRRALDTITRHRQQRILDSLKANKIDEYLPDAINDKLFKCEKMGAPCRGMPKCCGETQCFWEKGFSVLKKGVCVPCVNETQLCQFNDNCCGDMICYRGMSPLKMAKVDGRCHRPMQKGEECFFNKQCETKYCTRKWYSLSTGKCADEEIGK